MQLPQISIQSQNAMIGLNIKNAKLSIDSGPAKQTIKQPEAEIQINVEPGKLTIDQSKALADVGIIPVEQSVKKMAQEAMQTAIQGSKKRRHQGDQLMKIENGGNRIAQIAKQNGERPMKQFNIGWIPSLDGVKFDYQPARVDIKAKANEPIIRTEQTKNQFQYQPGGVEVYLKQKNWLEIDFTNMKFVGNHFEMDL